MSFVIIIISIISIIISIAITVILIIVYITIILNDHILIVYVRAFAMILCCCGIVLEGIAHMYTHIHDSPSKVRAATRHLIQVVVPEFVKKVRL